MVWEKANLLAKSLHLVVDQADIMSFVKEAEESLGIPEPVGGGVSKRLDACLQSLNFEPPSPPAPNPSRQGPQPAGPAGRKRGQGGQPAAPAAEKKKKAEKKEDKKKEPSPPPAAAAPSPPQAKPAVQATATSRAAAEGIPRADMRAEAAQVKGLDVKLVGELAKNRYVTELATEYLPDGGNEMAALILRTQYCPIERGGLALDATLVAGLASHEAGLIEAVFHLMEADAEAKAKATEDKRKATGAGPSSENQ